MSAVPTFGPLLPTDSLVERICEVWNLDYTPEEIAIEAEERAQAEEAQERQERQELAAMQEYRREHGGVW